MADPAISIIIPTLNEEESLASCLGRLGVSGAGECIVVDGGSSDSTREVALSHGVRLIVAPGGRAVQSNAGAALARGRILCFLHADTRLPEDWPTQVLEVIDVQGRVGGAFRFGLTGDRLAWRVIEAGVNWRSRRLKLPYGDQALFVRKDLFASLGGFKLMPFMEDVDLVFRLRRLGPIGMAAGQAFTCPRRWERDGVVATTIRNYVVLLGYLLGVRTSLLYRWYVRPRKAPAPPERGVLTGSPGKTDLPSVTKGE